METSQENASSKKFSIQDVSLKKTMDSFFDAVRNGKLKDILSFYADDLVAFDMMAPLQFVDLKQYEQIALKWCNVDAFEFPLKKYEFDLDKAIVTGDSALVFGLMHIIGKFKSGSETEARLRCTIFFQKRSDQWKIVHVHNSVPVNTDLKAMMNLKPGSDEEKEAIEALRPKH